MCHVVFTITNATKHDCVYGNVFHVYFVMMTAILNKSTVQFVVSCNTLYRERLAVLGTAESDPWLPANQVQSLT